MSSSCGARAAAMVCIALTIGPGRLARAQEADVQAAAAAFEQGQEAQLSGDYDRAAELFELADRLVPSPQALRSAIRNHRAAGNDARAATLAVMAFGRPGSTRDTRQLAEETLAELEGGLQRLLVHCEPACGLVVDGQAVLPEVRADYELFLRPGERSVQVTWEDGRARQEQLSAVAGERRELRFEAPEPDPGPEPGVEPEPAPQVAPEPLPVAAAQPPVDATSAPRSGLSPIVFATAAGVTALMGALYFWSLADTLKLRDDYEADPTEDRYDHGVDARRRTIAVGTVALGLAVGTAAVGIFGTDWGGAEREARLRPVPYAAPGGGGIVLSGTFGGHGRP